MSAGGAHKAEKSDYFVRWHIQRVHHHLEDILLDRAIGGQRSDPLETNRVDFEGFATAIVDGHPEAHVFPLSPEALLEAQTLIAALDGVASPRERDLLALLLDGASRQEAAAQLGIKRSTVDVLCFRLQKNFMRCSPLP
jgi:DNA-directed RNA polymerase specialized sigma24 family protein